VSEGTLAINSVSALGSTSGINLANATTLIYNGSAATLDRAISVTGGTGTLRNTGGALTLTGGLTKNGTTLTLDSGTLNVNTVGISGSAANSDLVIDGATVNLNIANTYNGPTRIIDGGTLNANVTGALPTANGRTAISIDATGTGSSRLVLGASQSIASLSGAASSNVTLGSNTLTVGTSGGSTTFAGRITGIGGLVKDGAGTLVLNGSNTYTGGTTISAGNLTISGGAALADNGLVTLSNTSGAVLSVSTSETIGSLSGGGGSGGDIVIGSGQALTVNQTTATTYSGGISGSGGLVKSGSGNLTLSGTNTYTGNTTVNGGTLNAAAANAAGGTTVIDVNSGSFLVTAANAVNDNAAIKLNGGTLAVSGTFEETVGALTLSANSTIDLAGFTGTLRFSGVGSWANTANLAIWNWNGINQYGTPVGDGANNRHVVFANNSGLSNYLDRISFYSDSGSSFAGNGFEQGFSGGSSEIIAVPETETYFAGILLILGATIYQLRLARQGRGFLACLRSHLQKTHRTP
jgi:autotransporter-associated beta strand protein